MAANSTQSTPVEALNLHSTTWSTAVRAQWWSPSLTSTSLMEHVMCAIVADNVTEYPYTTGLLHKGDPLTRRVGPELLCGKTERGS
jgi:hypothetical protein